MKKESIMPNQVHRQLVDILLVEDSPSDVRLMTEALAECDAPVRLNVIGDGASAISFLNRQDSREEPLPRLVVLDLNLPGENGWEVLRHIRNSASPLSEIPVIMLTTSANEEDIRRCYQEHANCYVVKPVDLDQFIDTVKSIQQFWLNTVLLPLVDAPRQRPGPRSALRD